MTPNNDVDTQRTATFIEALERLDRILAGCGNVDGVLEPTRLTAWPTQQMTATWGS